MIKYFLLLIAFFFSQIHAHELTENRANLSIRDNKAISINLFLNIADLLIKYNPQKNNQVQMFAYMSAIGDAEFESEFDRLFLKIQNEIIISTNSNANAKNPIALTWRWEDKNVLRPYFKSMLMDALTNSSTVQNSHFHEKQVKLTAYGPSSNSIDNIQFSAPSEFSPMTIVVARISQKSTQADSINLLFDFNLKD